MEEDRLASVIVAENIYIVNDNRIDRSKKIQKIKTGKQSSVVAAGGDQRDVDVSVPPQPPPALGRSGWRRFVITVLLIIAVVGLVLGLVHVLSWTEAAAPIIVGALGAIVAVGSN